MRAAISQPTYLPWIGYFGMIDSVDTFVFFDDVQFSKSSWHSRNKVKDPIKDDWMWLSLPTEKDGLGVNINEVRIKNSSIARRKHWQTIYHCYNKTPYFNRYSAYLQHIYEKDWTFLCDLNISLIKEISALLGINIPTFLKSSDLKDIEGKKTDRVLSVLDNVQADKYLSTEGTKVYLETEKFSEKNLELYWYNYMPMVYPQIGKEFIPYMSAIDLLFNTGDDSLQYLREGLKDAIVLDKVK